MEDPHKPQTRFIQCRLSGDLYEWLRLRAFLSRRSMNSIVLMAADDYRVAVDGGDATPVRGHLEGGRAVKYNVRVDDDLYEWLRTTAFFARVSINAVLLAALVRYRASLQDSERTAVAG